jgi:mannose-6-phosphate isomerase-like protein (cupin superfamily)
MTINVINLEAIKNEEILSSRLDTKTIVGHFNLPFCSIIKQGVNIDEPGNSIVFCSPAFPFVETAKACFPFDEIEDIKLSLNFVSIIGKMPEEEELHYHLSMIMLIVVEGKGILIHEKESIEVRDIVEKGDIVFIPRNMLHSFEGSPEVKYSVIEFGPVLDYQKHHYSKENIKN